MSETHFSSSLSCRGEVLSPSVLLDHVVDNGTPYPGDEVRFYTRIQAQEELSDLTLRITMDQGLSAPLEKTCAPGGLAPSSAPGMNGEPSSLIWAYGAMEAKATCEFQIVAKVERTQKNVVLWCRAEVSARVAGTDERCSKSETTPLAVSAQGAYLRYLPSLYQQDDFVGRFLMLVESFWKPIEQRIEQLPFYFDPKTAPSDMLPWLASWLGLVLDETMSEKERRALIPQALSLYRRRGTRRGMVEHLELLGQEAEVAEHRAFSLRLDAKSLMGLGLAVGQDERPHTITVKTQPRSQENGGKVRELTSQDERPRITIAKTPPQSQEDARLARARDKMIRDVIEAEKPAHIGYTLRIEH